MCRKLFILSLLLVLSVITADAHDLFLKFDTYFLRPNSNATVRLLNGSFRSSEGAVQRDRMRDVSLVAPGGTTHPATSDWRDESNTSLLNVRTAGAGTYVVSVSTLPREIELRAADFNEYLAHDGIPDTLAERRRNRQLNRDVRERYSKHVRAIFQVGDERTDDYRTPLGYPVEIIPQQNPYSLRVGQTIEVLCTLDGGPLANQYVLAGRERAGRMSRQISARTDANGIARFRLHSAGKWFIKMIHMTPLTDAEVNYESKWATLTFETR
ncbi:MAG: DUF4198 domain-containing protein [Acidobacteriota bacterium]|nr:DUF4198 domain-containing protein [Acidobacteriota bacterium]